MTNFFINIFIISERLSFKFRSQNLKTGRPSLITNTENYAGKACIASYYYGSTCERHKSIMWKIDAISQHFDNQCLSLVAMIMGPKETPQII